MNLIYKNEKPLYAILAVLSTIFWLAIILGTFGIVLIYLLFGFLIYLFVHFGFISYVKGTAVRVNETQFPELYKRYQECCTKLQLDGAPELYILNSDGMLNALATRFLRRNYVVLFSSVLDALKKYPDGLDFYIGHELGHIKRGHLNSLLPLWPASVLPLSVLRILALENTPATCMGCIAAKKPKQQPLRWRFLRWARNTGAK